MKLHSLLVFAPAAACASLPSVGPDYQRPVVSFPTHYRDVDSRAIQWRETTARSDGIAGSWWKIFDDPVLTELIERSLSFNLDLVASAERVTQARAAAGIVGSASFPALNGFAGTEKSHVSHSIENPLPVQTTTTHDLSVQASWEIDLFGRVRRLREAARADVRASQAADRGMRLAYASEVAIHYFSYRALTRELSILQEAVELRKQGLAILVARWQSGAGSELDVNREESELASAKADFSALERRRAAVANAVAVLLGQNPSDFSLHAPPLALDAVPPPVPSDLPSALLERRPDVIEAEALVEAANARVGVAKAAFFPAISLTGAAGYASADLGTLLEADSRVWSWGPALYLPLFQGGRNRANLARNRSAFTENVTIFRQSILKALKEVQDALTAAQLLRVQSNDQSDAASAARKALNLVQIRYDTGRTGYFEVIEAQRTVLSAERTLAELAAERFGNALALIKAIGGGWEGQNQPQK